MKSFYFALVLSFAPTADAGNCLPTLEITEQQLICATDSDCTFVGDACRSCGRPSVANKKFKTEIELKDRKRREAAKCVVACEACSRNNLAIHCKNGRCVGDEQAQ